MISDETLDAFEAALKLQKYYAEFHAAEDRLESLLGRSWEYPRVLDVDPSDDSTSGLQGRPGETHRATAQLRRDLDAALAARRGYGSRTRGA